MGNLIKWNGKSGSEYPFTIYENGTRLDNNEGFSILAKYPEKIQYAI